MKHVEGSLISYFNLLVKEQGGINLAQGISGFEPPDELIQILGGLIQNEKQLHQYPPGNGDFSLLQLVSDQISSLAPIGPDNCLIVQGATEGISLSFLFLVSMLKSKYSILSFDPPYESYPKLAAIYKKPFIYFNEFDDSRVNFDEKPFNPIQLGNQKWIFIGSFSKMLSIPGWRIGFVISETNTMKHLRKIHDYTGLCAPTLFQRAICEYLQSSQFAKDYTHRLRSMCHHSYNFLRDKLSHLGFKIEDIQGGYFLWTKLPDRYQDGFEYALQLFRKQKVAVVPGINFSPYKKNYIRMNFATTETMLHKAVSRIADFHK